MHEISDSGRENWHDYRIESRKEIIALLRNIGDKNQLVSMLVRGQPEACVTSVLAVEPDSGMLYLDCSINSEQNRRIAAAPRISFETSLDKIRILFVAENGVEATTHGGGPAFRMPIPDSLIRLQRREYYRMPTPVSNPVRAVIPMPFELGGGVNVFPLADISCGGIAILDNKLLLGNTIGHNYEGCKIELPEIGTVTTTLQIRNSLDITLLNSKTNRRLGCEFVDISRGNLANVQRYITKLERERNARLAGLG
ncbi:flagellar brake protein [Massilia cavernae]|uniref:Flagellar brake protein YcgR n=1 Tax=Massilia cavernae TaxID=2320864 RepID=A0A418XSN7_9BURK|nr:flagellar brake protein [Massilia cavernae]RJG15588.1 flagellar brake protein [Massilia cavernae]